MFFIYTTTFGYVLTEPCRTELSDEEIETIDDAGARGASRIQLKEIGKRLAWVGLLGALAVGFSLFSGVDIF